MPLFRQMTIETIGVENISLNDFNVEVRRSYRAVGNRHHDKYKHLKFLRSAFRRYGLRPRGRKYEQAKKRRGVNSEGIRATGEVAPFVFTGRTRELTMGGDHVEAPVVRNGIGSATVFLNAPQLNQIPWAREEFERVNRAEEKSQEQFGAADLERRLTNRKRRRRRTVRP